MRSLLSAALLCPLLMSCGLTSSCSGPETPAEVAALPESQRAPDKLDRLLRPSSAGLPPANAGPVSHGAAAAPTFGQPLQAAETAVATGPITVLGTARNAAMGAVVIRSDGRVWYLDKLSEWPDPALGKAVTVTGVEQQRKLAPDPVVGPDGAVSHGMQGTSRVLVRATWRVTP